MPCCDRFEGGDDLVGGSPSRVYVRPGHPRSGRAHVLGATTMGERSYAEGG